jgi:hypothetical protein
MTDPRIPSAEREPHWSAGAIGRIPDDDSLVFRDDAIFGKQFYAASPSEAEAAARFLNEIEDRVDAAERLLGENGSIWLEAIDDLDAEKARADAAADFIVEVTGRERANVDLLRAAIGMPDADASEVAAAIVALRGRADAAEAQLAEYEREADAELEAGRTLDAAIADENNRILRVALGDKWSALWGPELEELGNVVDAMGRRVRAAEARAEAEKRTNDALTIENLQLAAKAGMMHDIPETELRARLSDVAAKARADAFAAAVGFVLHGPGGSDVEIAGGLRELAKKPR